VDPLVEVFEERLQEIDAYLDLLSALEQQVQTGPPSLGGIPITAQQQRILYSSVYLQLYNLVEATVTWCISAVSTAANSGGTWRPGDLSADLRREWVRSTARTHIVLTQEHRLNSAVEMCNTLVEALPLAAWAVQTGNGGNWDDWEIESITARLGLELRISPEVYKAAKRKIRDDKSALVFIKDVRNRLAHGSVSFDQCGDGVTVIDLREIKERTASYLKEVIVAFSSFIGSYEFLSPDRRPPSGAQS
jgi:MAE_28990/MAE_18760-like HEPN